MSNFILWICGDGQAVAKCGIVGAGELFHIVEFRGGPIPLCGLMGSRRAVHTVESWEVGEWFHNVELWGGGRMVPLYGIVGR